MERVLAVLALFALTAMAGDTMVEVLTVRNRPAADLVSVLEPLAGRDGSVAAMDNRLIVRATPAALRRIKEVLGSLDTAPRTLWVTVRQDSAGTSRRTRVTGSFGATSDSESASDVQRLQCLEGRPAFIHVGRAIPIAQPFVPGTAYAEAQTGFWVLPRLAGDVVTLELAASKEAFESRGTIGVRQTQTTVTGRLGDWLPVSGSSLSREFAERSLAARGDARESQDWSVELKVEAGSE